MIRKSCQQHLPSVRRISRGFEVQIASIDRISMHILLYDVIFCPDMDTLQPLQSTPIDMNNPCSLTPSNRFS
jgi:hypothetical protein